MRNRIDKKTYSVSVFNALGSIIKGELYLKHGMDTKDIDEIFMAIHKEFDMELIIQLLDDVHELHLRGTPKNKETIELMLKHTKRLLLLTNHDLDDVEKSTIMLNEALMQIKPINFIRVRKYFEEKPDRLSEFKSVMHVDDNLAVLCKATDMHHTADDMASIILSTMAVGEPENVRLLATAILKIKLKHPTIVKSIDQLLSFHLELKNSLQLSNCPKLT